MIYRILCFITLFAVLFINPVSFRSLDTKSPTDISHVIAIAWDGVNEADAVPFLGELLIELKHKGYHTYFYGKDKHCTTGQPYNISLPAYSNFFSGTVDERIKTNTFSGKLKRKTLFDTYLNSQLFSSWKPLENVMSNSKSLVAEHSFIVSHNMFPKLRDDWLVKEAFTSFYLGSEFSFVHFGDADNYAHNRRYISYIKSIALSAKYTKEIVEHTETISSKGKLFIIFTDHARGKLFKWHSHGQHIPESKYIFITLVSSIPLSFNLPICDHTALNGIVKAVIPK